MPRPRTFLRRGGFVVRARHGRSPWAVSQAPLVMVGSHPLVEFDDGEAETPVLGSVKRDPLALDQATYGIAGQGKMGSRTSHIKPPLGVCRSCIQEGRDPAGDPFNILVSEADLDRHA